MVASAKLDDVCSGIARELYQLEEALALYDFIGSNASILNKASFGAFFGALQIILGRALLLHAARLVEDPKSNNPLRSIPAAMLIVRNEHAELGVPGRTGLVNALRRAGREVDESSNDADLTQAVLSLFESLLREIEETRRRLKGVRDRLLAHHEAIETELISKPTFSELDKLVSITQLFLDVVGWGYARVEFGHSRTMDGSRRAVRSLRRLLHEAHIDTVDTLAPGLSQV